MRVEGNLHVLLRAKSVFIVGYIHMSNELYILDKIFRFINRLSILICFLAIDIFKI
jgi:hypothetical protein